LFYARDTLTQSYGKKLTVKPVLHDALCGLREDGEAPQVSRQFTEEAIFPSVCPARALKLINS
jgi:hypothetical protein